MAFRRGRYLRAIEETVQIRRTDPSKPFGFELLDNMNCLIEQKRFLVNQDLTLNVQEKIFEVSVIPPNSEVQVDDHLIRIKGDLLADYQSEIEGLENPFAVSGVYVGHELIPENPVDELRDYVTGWNLRDELGGVSDGYILILPDNEFRISKTPHANPVSFSAIENLNVYDWINIGGDLLTSYFTGRFVSLTDEGDTYLLELSDVVSTFQTGQAYPVVPIQVYSNFPRSLLNVSENILRVQNIESHLQSQIIEAVEIGVLH